MGPSPIMAPCSPPLPVATIGTTLAAHLDLHGDCTQCRREIRIDTAALQALAQRYADTVLRALMERVVCRACGGRSDLRVHVPGLAMMGAITMGWWNSFYGVPLYPGMTENPDSL